jgi:hypothetical protein
MSPHTLQVVVALPAHAALVGSLTYLHTQPCPVGSLVRVPLGQRDVLGITWDNADATPAASGSGSPGCPVTGFILVGLPSPSPRLLAER